MGDRDAVAVVVVLEVPVPTAPLSLGTGRDHEPVVAADVDTTRQGRVADPHPVGFAQPDVPPAARRHHPLRDRQLAVLVLQGVELVVAVLSEFRVHVEDEDVRRAGPQTNADDLVGAEVPALTDARVRASDLSEERAYLTGDAAGLAEPAATDERPLDDPVARGAVSGHAVDGEPQRHGKRRDPVVAVVDCEGHWIHRGGAVEDAHRFRSFRFFRAASYRSARRRSSYFQAAMTFAPGKASRRPSTASSCAGSSGNGSCGRAPLSW